MAAFSNCSCWLQSPSSPRIALQSRLRISTAHNEWNHVVLGLVAMEKGYFREEGLEDVELIAFANDEKAQVEALISGLIDIAMDPLIHRVLTAQDKGADIYIVAPRRKMHSFVIFGQKWMKSIQDLKGQTLHIKEDGETIQQLKQIVRMGGLEWGKDVKIVHTTPQFMHDPVYSEKRFLSGERLLLNVLPWEAEQWSNRGYPILADTKKLFPPRQDRVVVATGKLANERQDTLEAFLKAYIKASRFLVDRGNESETRTIVEKAGFLDNDVDRDNFPTILKHVSNRLATDGSLPVEGVEQAIREQREAGNISDRVSIEKVLRLEALHQAQAKLGIEVAQS